MTDETTDRVAQAKAPTLRTSLRERRAEAQSKLFLDRKVPRIDPAIWIRFGPIPGHKIDSIQKALEKSKDTEKTAVQNAVALADSCIGIYQVALEGEDPVTYLHGKDADERGAVGLVSIDPDAEDPVVFGEKLADLLGIPYTGKAVPVVRALYLTDGDIVSEAGELTVWSGFARRDGDEDYSGN